MLSGDIGRWIFKICSPGEITRPLELLGQLHPSISLATKSQLTSSSKPYLDSRRGSGLDFGESPGEGYSMAEKQPSKTSLCALPSIFARSGAINALGSMTVYQHLKNSLVLS